MKLSDAVTIAAPLLLASAALAFQEAHSSPVARTAMESPPEEYRPPALPEPRPATGERSLRIDPEHSRAWSWDGATRAEELRVEGTVTLSPDGTWTNLELTVTPRGAASAREDPIVFQGFDAPSAVTPVPRVLHALLRVRANSPGRLEETSFSASWLRLPGGAVRMQAVADLTPSFRREGAGSGPGLLHHERPSIALDLLLEEAP